MMVQNGMFTNDMIEIEVINTLWATATGLIPDQTIDEIDESQSSKISFNLLRWTLKNLRTSRLSKDSYITDTVEVS